MKGYGMSRKFYSLMRCRKSALDAGALVAGKSVVVSVLPLPRTCSEWLHFNVHTPD